MLHHGYDRGNIITMKITKYEHACLLINKGGIGLLIDPGSYTKLPAKLEGISTIVITHEHFDHLNIPNLRKVLEQNPKAEIFSTKHVTATLKEEGISCQPVEGKLATNSGGFELHFEEVDHSIIYEASPCRNLSVGVGDFLYYPGDSFVGNGRKYELLALPASGPWFNMAKAIDLAKSFDARHVFATHDIHASERGYDSFYSWIGRHIRENSQMIRLGVGESRNF